MKKVKVWMNGRSVDINAAKISVFDRGFLYGDGLFETMRSYGGKIFKPDEHLSRLFGSSKIMRIKVPYSKRTLEKAIYRIIGSNGLKDAYIRITVTRGEGVFSLKRDKGPKPNVVIIVKEYEGYPQAFYARGISAKVSGLRQNESSPLSKMKTSNFLNYILARIDAQSKGFDEAILMNMKGDIAEAATGNIFLVRRGGLITPSLNSGILPGITREEVIKIAKRRGMRVTEKAVLPGELFAADEVFLTNSLAEILPVVKVGRVPIGGGRPGKITKLLQIAYRREVNK